jgi:hypothetical protein
MPTGLLQRFIHHRRRLVATAAAAASLLPGAAIFTAVPTPAAAAAQVPTTGAIIYVTVTDFATPVDPHRCVIYSVLQVNSVSGGTIYRATVAHTDSNLPNFELGIAPPYAQDSYPVTSGQVTVTLTAPPGTHRRYLGSYSTGAGCDAGLVVADLHYQVVSVVADIEGSAPPTDPDFVALTPGRLLDTRPNASTADGLFGGGGPRSPGSTLALTVTGRAGVKPENDAVALNVTVTNAAGPGYLTVFPCGETQPTASNLNFAAGQTIPNAVVAKIGTGGAVCIFTSQTVDLVADVTGAFPVGTAYVAGNPTRVLETRPGLTTVDGLQQGGGPAAAGSTTIVQITGRAGVPAGAAAVSLNVTVTEPSASGFVTVYPCGGNRPTASNVNFTPGLTIPNLVIAKIGAGGAVCIYTLTTTHLVVDVNGYFPASSTFTPLDPARLLETRSGLSTVDHQSEGLGPRAAGATTVLHVGGRGGVPSGVRTIVLNVTVTEAAGDGFVTVYPCDVGQPLASNLNFSAGQTIANAVITKVSATGDVCLFNSQATHLIADANGVFV